MPVLFFQKIITLAACTVFLSIAADKNTNAGDAPAVLDNSKTIEPTTYVWVEDPTKSDFKTPVNWSVLSEKKAMANIPVGKNNPAKENAFAEYDFTVKGKGGKMTLWGRTFDPNWSSPMRWRIDEGEWMTWSPGKMVDRQVENKAFPIQWHKWGEVDLSTGEHKIRLEILGKRKRGDYPYFVQDVLLFTLGDFTPAGTATPAERAKDLLIIAQEHAKGLPEEKEFAAKALKIQEKALTEDLGALKEFATLGKEIEEARHIQKLLKDSDKPKINGRMENISIDQSGNVNLQMKWNGTWRGGKIWIGFSKGGALYSCHAEQSVEKTDSTITIPLPENLPAGKVMVQCVPMGSAATSHPHGYIDVRVSKSAKDPKPMSWGLYRDSMGIVHPWHVNANNMMFWDGEPYIPFGGMLNSPMTWNTKAGDNNWNKQWEEVLKQQFIVLKKNGIRDVYFNGTFVRTNPQAIARVVALCEEYGMRYGLHCTSTPDNMDIGFVAETEPTIVPAGTASLKIEKLINGKDVSSNGRILWYAVDGQNRLVDYGISKIAVQDKKATQKLLNKFASEMNDTKKRVNFLKQSQNKSYWIANVTLAKPAPEKGLTIRYFIERHMDRSDPSGYLGTVEEYLQRYKGTYGDLNLGKGMRMWIDPFQNEFHYNPRSINTTEKWKGRYASWLMIHYGNIDALRKAWGNTNEPLIETFMQAATLLSLHQTGETANWLNPDNSQLYTFITGRNPALRDLQDCAAELGEEMISKAADALKQIADVPVILKHNCWFSKWFVNPRTHGGMDGVGYEPYCYGDSLAYHNSLAAYAEVMQSAKNQWALVTESSAAAFEGQKKYCGYIDRLQMIYDIDQLTMFGSKGFYHFGFSFAGNPMFDTTDLLRDIRQIEWLSTHHKTYLAASKKLATYRPEVYGWFPAYLRQDNYLAQEPAQYEMDGHYTAVTTQIRQAPDGRWIVPASTPNAPWHGLLVAEPLLNPLQKNELITANPQKKYPVYVLQSDAQKETQTWPETFKKGLLNGFTSDGIGIINPKPHAMTLSRFQKEILGYEVFQTADINGKTCDDNKLMIWTCAEKKIAEVVLNDSTVACDINGKTIPLTKKDGKNVLVLQKPPYEKKTKDFPPYILGGRYYYPDLGQPEVAFIRGITVKELLAANTSIMQRWLPKTVSLRQVIFWQEAEDGVETTFTQPRLEGFTRYSNGCAIGINTHNRPPEGKTFHASYRVTTPEIQRPKFWLRRMEQMAKFMDIKVKIDGVEIGTFSDATDIMHLNPWSAGLSRNNLNVAWFNAQCNAIPAGEHTVDIVVTYKSANGEKDKIDTKLMGGAAEVDVGRASNADKLSYLQIDSWMLVETNE